MTSQQSDFYKRDRMVPHTEFLGFRCYKPLAVALKSRAMTEKSDTSALIRRLLCTALAAEGVDVVGLPKP